MKPPPSLHVKGGAAELFFMGRMMAAGLRVSKPLDGASPYDAVVECPSGRLCKVQVKSGAHEGEDGRFSFRAGRNTRVKRPYTPEEVDFVVLYVIPFEAWYIVPISAIGERSGVSVFPRRKVGKYERYREAWHLLTGESAVAGRQ